MSGIWGTWQTPHPVFQELGARVLSKHQGQAWCPIFLQASGGLGFPRLKILFVACLTACLQS